MQDSERPPLTYTKFEGLSTNADPRDIGLGAVQLDNLTLAIPGQLTSRKGHGTASFANDSGTADADILGLFRFEMPAYKFVLTFLSHGGVAASRDPEVA